MNDQLDKLLQEALAPSGHYDAQKAESVKREVTRMYEEKLKHWRDVIWTLLAIDAAFIVGGVLAFVLSSDVKTLIGSAAVVLWAFMSTVMMRLWYWQMESKFSVLKELAELRLQVAGKAETDEPAAENGQCS